MAQIDRPTRGASDPHLVDCNKASVDIRTSRYESDPRHYPRGFHGDPRFWLPFQADWYESVIMKKRNATTDMKYVD